MSSLTPALLGGCAFDEHREALRADFASGQYEAAQQALQNPANVKLYGEKNELLLRLDQGSVALALHENDQAIADLNQAEALMDARREETLAESLGVLLINDQRRPYIAEPYEELYVNVLKMLAQFEAGRIEGGATVEARRMATKANLLRDEYITQAPKVRQEAHAPGSDAAVLAPISGVASVNEQGQFIESPLGLFLTAVAFMESGDPSNQAVAGRRLQEAIALQKGLIGDVNPAPFESLGSLSPADVNVMVVAFSGRGPHKEPLRIPLLIYETPIYIDLPILRWQESEAARARVVERAVGGEPSTAVAADLHLIEDLSLVANENHKRELPMIYFRTLVRTGAKSVALTFASSAASRAAHNDAAGIATALGGLALLMATERADLRCWVFLPGQARVGLMKLPPGKREIRVEYLSAGGGLLYASPWRVVDVEDARLATVVENYWR